MYPACKTDDIKQQEGQAWSSQLVSYAGKFVSVWWNCPPPDPDVIVDIADGLQPNHQ